MMNDADELLTRRLRDCLSDRHLPSGFSDRLVRSVRRRRRVSRTAAVVSVIVACVLVMGFVGYFSSEEPKATEKPALVAAQGPVKTERVSGWLFLGFFRECFKRNKTNKRKEEEP